MELTGRAALITGGKRLGAAVAVDLAGQGVDVALSYRQSLAEAEQTAAAIETAGRRAFLLQTDLSRGAACQELVDRAAASLGRLDILINMASVYTAVPFGEADEAVWDSVVNVDLKASYLCARAAVPHMRRQGGGRIINFTDWVAASGRPRYTGFLPYYVAKKGVIGLTEALALELAADQILVNAIAPGPIVAPAGTSDEEKKAVEAATPLGRWGGAAEVTAAVRFFLTSGFVTGETVRVDGGRHVR
ncbi:MAG: SDR family oxidoreductase [Acidobacteria bacterium]|nr:SDR family oxidoreductase [Acidobacteriota bacterium]MCA1651662.1 SDR family oxidoreductase [Acidobacteriota bacterium]